MAVVGRRLPGSFHSSPSEMIGHHKGGGNQDIIKRVALSTILVLFLVSVINYSRESDLGEKVYSGSQFELQSVMVGGGVRVGGWG